MKVERKALLGALRKVKPALRGPVPMYKAVRMAVSSRPDGLGLTISGTNGLEAVSVEIGADTSIYPVTGDPAWFAVVVEADRLLRWLDREWADEVSLSLEKDRLVVEGRAKVKLGTLPAEDFPEIPQTPDWPELVTQSVFTWSRTEVDELVRAAKWVDPSEVKEMLRVVHVWDGELYAGTGARAWSWPTFAEGGRFQVTKETVGLLDGLVSDGVTFSAGVDPETGRSFFRGEGFLLSQGRIEGAELGGQGMKGFFGRVAWEGEGEDIGNLDELVKAVEAVVSVWDERSQVWVTPFQETAIDGVDLRGGSEAPWRTLIELRSEAEPSESWFEGWFPAYKTVKPADLVLALHEVARAASVDSKVTVSQLKEWGGVAFEVTGPEGVRCRAILSGVMG